MTLDTKNRNFFHYSRLDWCGGAILAGVLLCGAAHAQTAQGGGSSLFPGIRTNVPEPLDWVKKSRPPKDVLYDRRTSVPANEPEGRPLQPDELRKLEAEMNALRRRHQRAGNLPRTQPGRTAAAPPGKATGRGKPGCVLTCNIGLGRVSGQ